MEYEGALAPAKVNLTLAVTGRRSDGYHLLDSVVAFTDFGDRISVMPAEEVTLAVDGPFAAGVPVDEGNLVFRAAQILRQSVAGREGAAIRLTKNLPVASGIGGGSSDAAQTLLLLDRMWETGLSRTDLASLALMLGADVPVCLEGRACRMRSIGERVDRLRLPECGIVLVNPMVPCSTAAVFKRRDGAFSPMPDDLPDLSTLSGLCIAVDQVGNDLLTPAISECPEIGVVLASLEGVPGVRAHGMSGSGATCFGLFDDAATAKRASDALRTAQQAANWWVHAGVIAGD